MSQDTLFQSLPESSPPPLVEARKKLAYYTALQEADTNREAFNASAQGASLKEWQAEVTRLEEIAATEAK